MTSAPFIDVPTLDRSTLQAYADCPWMAVTCEREDVSVPEIAHAGQEAHDPIGLAITDYVASGGNVPAGEIAEGVRQHARGARPDLQPDVCDALKRSTWKIGQLIAGRNPNSFMRWDGGEGGHCGQLAVEVPLYGVIVTSEVDLLLANRDQTLLEEWDWKTGRKCWCATDIANSFQFQMHCFLLFSLYESVQRINIRILNTRHGTETWDCEFERRDFAQYEGRVVSAVGIWQQFHDAEEPEARPNRDKCAHCSVATQCPSADADIRDVAADPEGAVDQLVAVEAKATAIKKLLSPIVERDGAIRSANGNGYGFKKSNSSRKPPKGLFTVPKTDEPAEADGGPTKADTHPHMEPAGADA